MKFLLATAALALGAAAQSIGDLPQCSLPCFIQYVPSTGCALTDVACLCKQQNIMKISNDITTCVEQKCGDIQDDLKTLTVVNGICAMNGGTSIPTPSLPAGVPASAAPSSSSSIKPGPVATYFTAGAPKALPTAFAGVLGAAGVVAGLAL